MGSFPSWGRWAEWNGRFRDEVRRFVKSDPGVAQLMSTRLAGSPDLYAGGNRAPWHSINFLTSHDGFTLADPVSYNDKQNWQNGEGNSSSDSRSGSSASARPARRCGGGRAMHLLAAHGDDPIYLIANAHWEPRTFELPTPRSGGRLVCSRNTQLAAPALTPGPGLRTDRALRTGPALR